MIEKRNVAERRARGKSKKNSVTGQPVKAKGSMFVNTVNDLMTGITISIATKSMNVARRMHSNVQSVAGSFLINRTASTTLKESTKLSTRPLTNTWQLAWWSSGVQVIQLDTKNQFILSCELQSSYFIFVPSIDLTFHSLLTNFTIITYFLSPA